MSRISDLILARARVAGDLRRQQGQTYGDLAHNLSQIPAMWQQNQFRQQAQDLALRREGRLDEEAQSRAELAKRQLAGQERQQQEASLLGEAEARILDPATGRVDRSKLNAIVQEMNIPHKLPDLLKFADSVDAARDAYAAKKAQTDAEHRADMAQNLLPNFDPDEFRTVVTTMAKDQVLDPQQADSYLRLDDPAKMTAVLNSWIRGSKKHLDAQKTAADIAKTEAETKGLLNPQSKPTAVTEAQLDAKFQALQSKVNQKQPLTPEEKADYDAYRQRKTLVSTTNFNMNAPRRDDARTDRAYAQSKADLDKLRNPLEQQSDRMSRLVESINQRTPAADALIAPELLTVIAGGQGSGVRMTEAELSRIIGGRSKIEGLKAALNEWRLDPTKALSITDDQRRQIGQLVDAVRSKATKKMAVLDAATNALIDAADVDTQRKVVAKAHKDLQDISTGDTDDTVEEWERGPDGKLRKKGSK